MRLTECKYCKSGHFCHASPPDLSKPVALAEWLVKLDEPGNEERKTITLNKIIERARESLQ